MSPVSSEEFPVGESFARILTEATQSLVCVLDRDGKILLFNEACERATGFRREELLGRDARDFVIPPEEREAFGEFLAYVWKTGTPSPQVGHWQTKDGSRRLIAWSNKPMAGRGGAPASLVTTGIDLTDRAPRREDDERALEGDPEAKLAEVSRLATEQRALRRVATLVASEVSPERVFTAVSEECARVLQVNASLVLRYEGDGTATIVGRHNRDNIDEFRVGERLPAEEHSAFARVLATGAPARIDDWGGLTGEVAEAIFRTGYRSTAAAPIIVAGTLWGAVAIASEDPLPPESEERLAAFCELASLAVASAQARADLIASRARLVKAGDEQRRRLERNLHDGAQQRFVSVVLKLRLARARLASHPEATARPAGGCLARARHRRCRSCARSRAGCIRRSSATSGCGARWKRSPTRLTIPVDIDAADEPLPEHVEATAYYIVSEALTNVAKHAAATSAPGLRPPRRRRPALRGRRRRPGRRGHDERDRHPRPARSGRGGRRDAVAGQPAGRGTVVVAVLPLTDG